MRKYIGLILFLGGTISSLSFLYLWYKNGFQIEYTATTATHKGGFNLNEGLLSILSISIMLYGYFEYKINETNTDKDE